MLELKVRDLDISFKNTFVQKAINQVLGELKAKRIRVTPTFWASDEWFCPDGIVGVGIPFYLADERLISLEKSIMGKVEGETMEWCLKLLRHEVGHAIDNAFKLRRNSRNRSKIFGKCSTPYPRSYKYRPYSKNFVHNLEEGYAQSHASEDFAETFAIWLNPRSSWRTKYKEWPCISKLKFVDELMGEIKGKRPLCNDKEEIYPVSEMNFTLGEFYKKRKRQTFRKIECLGSVLDHFETGKVKIGEEIRVSDYLKRNKRTIINELQTSDYYKYELKSFLDRVICEAENENILVSKKDAYKKSHLALQKNVDNFIKEGGTLINL